MDERSETEKIDEVMLPGFRFHPTDEELVGFYLKRKVQQRPLSIELIKQLDIYKYDPWDLPKLATTGEKEWYFYCPRDRKYRNSTRPNRVTGAGFWKATGTDRPIYSSDQGSKCIGLKKSLVFYRGRAAKGIKTDWMMHEFRLPSLTDSAPQIEKRFVDKTIPANDSWAICRIFKKTNSTAQRAISQTWVSPSPETTPSEILSQGANSTHFTSESLSLTAKSSTSPLQVSSNNNDIYPQSCITSSFCPSYVASCNNKPINNMATKTPPPPPPPPPQVSISNGDLPTSYPFSSLKASSKCSALDTSSMFLNMSSSAMFGDFWKHSEAVDHFSTTGLQEQYSCFTFSSPQEMQAIASTHGEETSLIMKDDQNGANLGFPTFMGLPQSMTDSWKSNLLWVSSPCPSEMSTSYSTNKCYL